MYSTKETMPAVSMTVLSGLNQMSVPRLSVSPTTAGGPSDTPREYDCSYTLPLRCTRTLNHSDRKLTQVTPTPCRPPDTL
jgi:hypothetical protein